MNRSNAEGKERLGQLNEMDTTEKQDPVNALRQLALRIKREVDDRRSRGLIQPEEEPYFRWKVDKFRYTKEGVTISGAKGEHSTKKSWFKASSQITDCINKSQEYSSALGSLTESVGKKSRIPDALGSFTGHLIVRYLDEGKLNDADLDAYVTVFMKDIREEPVRCGAEVQLDGIVIIPGKVEFRVGDTAFVLRQTRIEDLERKRPAYWPSPELELKQPSAILNIEYLGRGSRETQIRVEQAISILRLFKVGSVQYISYRMYSECVTNPMLSGTLSSQGPRRVLETSQIGTSDGEGLENFWQTMIQTLSPGFYDIEETKIDHLIIAYERYCDALLQDGVSERRIANAVMGLESLFLKGGEIQELAYRLSMRIAKIFGLLGHECLGYDWSQVRRVVNSAYKVRNLFVHGSHLSDKEKRKLNNKFGNIGSFLLKLLDCLRICLVIILVVKKEKEEFLDLIDDALVDEEKARKLASLLKAARSLLSGT